MFAIFALAFSFAGCKSDDSDSSESGSTGGTTSGSIEPVAKNFVKIPAVSLKGTEYYAPGSVLLIIDRKIEIASFYISDHPVTRGEYKAVMGSDPSTAKAYDKDGNELEGDDNVKNNPVNYISWYDALVYCNTRSIKENLTPCYTIDGKTDPSKWGTVPASSDDIWNAAICDFDADGYRLPTEVEWAVRGKNSYYYAGSDDINEVAWYTVNTNDTGTRDVKTKNPNGYGLYDMSGNVYEWCWDWYGSISSGTVASGPASGSSRCLRGGSWNLSAKYAQVSFRGGYNPSDRNNRYGFRLVRTAK